MVERRVHTVYVTRNTEYHVRRDVCVAVRDRKTGQWLSTHHALQSRVQGGLLFSQRGGISPNPGRPKEGECLYLSRSGRDVVTSAIMAVERPTREVVAGYDRAPNIR